eukprot:3935306-Rhodomonas_salina.1
MAHSSWRNTAELARGVLVREAGRMTAGVLHGWGERVRRARLARLAGEIAAGRHGAHDLVNVTCILIC